jgi:hypothetical protein
MAPERYIIGRELARGGMGAIHEATDVRLSRTVAVKQLLVQTPHSEARLTREALLTARLQHPAIVPIFDIGERPDHGPFYAMKLVDGISLDRAIAQAETLAARLALLPHAVAAVDAVAYAHSHGIVHRDLKPHNVLVGAFGETVVVDWGLAKEIQAPDDAVTVIVSPDEQLTRVGTVIGTPTYMAPEQAAGTPVDARADVYALGAVLYHLLSGRRPAPSVAAGGSGEGLGHRTSRLLRAEPRLPTDLVTIVEKAMAPAAADRYATAGELAADLRRFQTGQLVGAHRYTPWQLVRRIVVRQPAAFSLVGLVVLALVFAIAVLVVRQVRVRETRQTKRALDGQILELESAMADTRDPATLRTLEDRLNRTVGRALVASQELAGATTAVGRGDDPLERRIHAVLAGFDADTYSIPPRFRSVVAATLDMATRRVTSPSVQDAKRTVWPIITRELDTFGLPRELGYLAWMESGLKASTRGPLGQAGVWQLMPATARERGLRVDDAVDERFDVTKSTHIVAQMFAEAFAQFGDDATLMAVLAYPLGEEKTRRFVREIAMEQGAWRSGRRSYWHLLRTHRLSAETEEYVPRVVALILADRGR